MSPVTEAQQLYFNQLFSEEVMGYMLILPRRFSQERHHEYLKDRLLKESVISWDRKLRLESKYASGELERFKQDQLPQILNKLS